MHARLQPLIHRSFVRRGAPFVTVAAALILLAGCSSSSTTPKASSTPSASSSSAATAAPLACVSGGSASEAVKVTGASTGQPTVKFPTPISVSATQKTVVTPGSGAKITEGQSVQIAYSVYEGTTGKQLDTAGYDGKSAVILTVDPAQYLPGLMQAIDCGQAGSRIASVIPASEAFGATGSESLGVGANDSIVFVVDIRGITPTRATGASKALPAGFPTVTLASTGQPTVTIPKATAPTTLKIAESKTGTGDTVKSGDSVTLQYQGVLWRTGKVFDESWGKTGPTSLTTTAVVKGFGTALVGHKVGSQVVAIIPPAEGYGTGGSTAAGIKGTDTMVFVIDILATTHAATK